jgi:hypothetical protein
MAAGVAALFAVGAFAIYAAYDQSQMEGTVTDPLFEIVGNVSAHVRETVHSVAVTVADHTD